MRKIQGFFPFLVVDSADMALANPGSCMSYGDVLEGTWLQDVNYCVNNNGRSTPL